MAISELMTQFPSDIIEVVLPCDSHRTPVLIPHNEIFRVHNIFMAKEYGIPPVFIPSGSATIVDIGANVGLFALYMKNLKPDSHIICFEPAPDTLKLLLKNLQAHKDVSVYPIALSDRNGNAEMMIHTENTGENSIKHSNCGRGNTVTVQVRDAGAVFQKLELTYIDILKIDTEGCEVEILESLQRYLPYIGIIMVEYHSEKDRRRIDQLLAGHSIMGARIENVQVGTVRYINSRLLGGQ